MPKLRPPFEEPELSEEPERELEPEREPEPEPALAADTQDVEPSEARQKFLAGEMRWRDYCAAEAEEHAEPLQTS
jgi:hypothetical protein